MSSESSRYHEKPCTKCGRNFQPSGPRSTTCKREDCESAPAALASEAAPAKAKRRISRASSRRRVVAARADPAAEPEAQAELTALDVIDRFELDYNLGNTVRFVLEKDDGDPLENLQSARTYLERAIAKLGGAE
jgi:hypothetical protein